MNILSRASLSGGGKRLRVAVEILLLVGLLAALTVAFESPSSSGASTGNRVLLRELRIELGKAQRAKWQMPVSSGVVYPLLESAGVFTRRAEQVKPSSRTMSAPATEGCQTILGGGQNIRVNQDCSFRRQAEETIAINPNNPRNLVAGQNDSRIGFNHCGYDWSFNGGRTWGDMVPPFYQFILEDGHTADACSDPTATFDAESNVYVGGVLFDLGSPASAFVVAKSSAPNGGAFYHSPAVQPFQEFSTDPIGVVASDNDPNIFNDKEFIVADASPSSPKVNNVYGTWTRFNFATGEGVGANSPIYFSQSEDGGETWSPGIEISGSNAALCTDFSGEADPNACDQDQGSHPIVGRDGTVYVIFGNGNTPLAGINQALFVKCPAGNDCSDPASWSDPVKVGDLINNLPFGPDAATGCSAGRTCIPPNGYRVTEFTSMSISADRFSNLYAVWSDFRNGGFPCTGSAETAAPPCDNDVFYSFSTDGGATWSEARNITPASKFGENAQWQPWSAVVSTGRKLKVGYYDRSYGRCEMTGCNDITLATITAPRSAQPGYSYKRITTGSMPNLLPDNNPFQAGFLGDYMWVAVDERGRAHVVWADTRGRAKTVEEDIYFFKE